MLEVISITKKFQGQENPAVNNISFTVRPGEIAALLGENGAGKTTTMRIISTILTANSGTCLVNNFDTVKNPEKARECLGMLLGGETGLYDRLTARENIAYFADLHRIPEGLREKRIKSIASLLDMGSYLDRRCGTFSRGMKQKTAFARALIHDPAVILLDEPTTGMDVSSSLTVRDFILRCKNDGRAILFSSHNIDEVNRLADRVIIIHNGRLAENEVSGELPRKYSKSLESVYLDLTRQEERHG